MDLGRLIAGLPVRLVAGPAGTVRVADLTEDSRTVMPGSLFVARPGHAHDGRLFAGRAVADGAVAVLTDSDGVSAVDAAKAAVLVSDDLPLAVALLAERFFGEPSSKLRTVGVTGTNGKSTVVHLVHGLMNAAGHRCGLIGTVTIDDGREVAGAEMTTLPAIELSRTLASMVEHGCECVAMEVSSHALDQGRVAGVEFDAAVFTMLGRDHLEYHGSFESYADAKAKLFSQTREGGTAIVNADDPTHARMLAACSARRVLCSMWENDATVRIEHSSVEGMRLALRGPFGDVHAELPMPGPHNAMNVLQAAVAAHAIGARPEELLGAAKRLTPPPGRLERVRSHAETDGVRVFVDYAHTADALEHTLAAMRTALQNDSETGELWVVFGCGGDRDKDKRPAMGEVAASLADRVVLTSDNPRGENPSGILDAILSGISHAKRAGVAVHADRGRAIEAAIAGAAPGDVVVIAGKGHERTQTSADSHGRVQSIAFDDRVVAQRALEARAAMLEQAGHK